MKKLITILICLSAILGTANANTYYVNTGLATGANNGSSWADAYRTLGAASTAAGTNAGVDDIYITGAITVSGTWTMSIGDNYYGSFDPNSSNSDPLLRPLNDNDGNGITEPWEFKFPTTFTSTAPSGNAITGNTGILDGFTITHTATAATATTKFTTLSSIIGQTVQNCVFTGSTLTYGTTNDYNAANGGCLLKVLGTFKNNLVEKNTVNISTNGQVTIAPILDVTLPPSGTVAVVSVSGCIFRNNLATVNYGTTGDSRYFRGGIINIFHAVNTSASATFSDCIIQNNEVNFSGGSAPNTTGGIVSSYGTTNYSSTDKFYHCLFANNKVTNLYACFFALSSASINHQVYNCVFWNNTGGVKSNTIYSNSTQYAGSKFDYNYLDADKAGFNGTAWSLGWGTNNKIDLSKTNTTANTGPQFIKPPLNGATNVIGSYQSAGTELTAISKSDWRMLSNSYLYHKGDPSNTIGVSKDKAGLDFYYSSNPSVGPTVGPYEYALIPIISWTQDLTTLATGGAPVTLTAASTITPASTPAGTDITYTSGDENIVTVSGNTLTIVGTGTTTVTAHQAANANYPAASDVSQTVTVRLPQTITYSTLPNKVYGTAPFTLTASASSGLPVTFVSTKTYIATVSGNTVTIVATGTNCRFNVYQAGDATYAPVSLLNTIGFSVTPKPLTISGLSVPSSKEYDGTTNAVVTDNKALLVAEAIADGTTTDGKPYTGDAVSITGTPVATYNSKDVSTATTVTYSGLSLTGAQAANYTLIVTTPATITTKPLTIGAPSIASKVYDGNTNSATVNPGSLSGFVGSETVTVSTARGTYADANVGTGKTANIVYTLANGDNGGIASNYSLVNGSATGDITAIPSSPASGNLGSASTLPGTDITVASGVVLNVNNNASVHSITVQPGGMLTLADGNTLNAPLVLQNTGSATASFIDGNSGNTPPVITATVQQDIPAKDRNWYVSVPVSGKTAGSITLSGSKIVTRNEANVSWDDVTAGSTLTPGVGYIAVGSASSGTASWNLSGNLNSGNVPVTLTASGASFTGFNLVGNPYPSYLNWEQVLNLSSLNAALVQPTIWYRTGSWNNTSKKYDYTFQTYNSASRIAVPTSASGYIPPMQAFWVRANTGGTLTFTNAMRSHGDGTVGFGSNNLLKAKSTVVATQSVLRLQVNNTVANTSDETVVYFNPAAQNGYDAYDSPKMLNNSATVPDIYTMAGKENLVINGMNAIPYDTEIPLGFAPGSGTSFQLKATGLTNFEAGTQILLTDKGTGAITNLAAGDIYIFNNSVSASGRFSLVFKAPSVTTGISGNNTDLSIHVFRNGCGQVTVSCPEEVVGKATMSMYNAVGQNLEAKQLENTITVLNNSFAPGVYFVTVVANGKTITRKVVIN